MNLELSTGVRYHIREHGQGAPTYLLIHGWAVSGAVWEPVLAQWPEAAGRVLVPDLRGTGFSSKPRKHYDLADYSGDVVALIDQMGLTDLILVGHSMGGVIAQMVALERPDALRSLVLLSPVPASGIPFGDEDLKFMRSLAGHREGAEQLLGSMMARRPAAEQLERMVTDVATVDMEAFLGGFDAWRTASFGERIGGIRTPTLVLGGSEEQPLSPALLRSAVVDQIPGARFEELPGVGHYAQVECTALLIEKLVAAAGLPDLP